jgi:transposase InsO family protein
MNIDEKMTLILAVEESGFKVTEALKRLDMPRSTYYRWRAKLKREGLIGLKDKRPVPKKQWNSITPLEEEVILKIAEKKPELSSREISFSITDEESFTVSESTVYRILKREGLIRDYDIESFPAAKEYHTKPTYVNEQWQTDATYLHVEGWGWFYLISILDDFSRKIISWKIQNSMTAEDFIEVVDDACEKAGLDRNNMPNLVSDRGPALISGDLRDYLNEQDIHHILASPYHPQTNGKIERYHKSLKSKVKLHIYACPNELKAEVGKFISNYNKNRYHESLGNVTPDDVFYGRREKIVKAREDKRRLTLMRRKEYNRSPNAVMLC